MKKLVFLFLGIFSLVALDSCDKRDDIRADIDGLNVRLDSLDSMVAKLNADLPNYQALLNGKVLVLDYQVKANGDYTLELSNGQTVTVYSGKPAQEMPLFSIGEDHKWYYTQEGETYPLLGTDGQQAPALGENGVTPLVKVEKGMWKYSLDGGKTWQGNIGPANPEMVGAGNSIFTGVSVSDNGLTFEWENPEKKGETLTQTVPLYGGLDLKVDYGTDTPSFSPGESKSFPVTQTGVDNVVIETNTWGVKLEEKQITVKAPEVNVSKKEYTDRIILKIFSKEGYCRVVQLPVTLKQD